MSACLLRLVGLLTDVLWPRPAAPSPAAIHYYESVLEERERGRAG